MRLCKKLSIPTKGSSGCVSQPLPPFLEDPPEIGLGNRRVLISRDVGDVLQVKVAHRGVAQLRERQVEPAGFSKLSIVPAPPAAGPDAHNVHRTVAYVVGAIACEIL